MSPKSIQTSWLPAISGVRTTTNPSGKHCCSCARPGSVESERERERVSSYFLPNLLRRAMPQGPQCPVQPGQGYFYCGVQIPNPMKANHSGLQNSSVSCTAFPNEMPTGESKHPGHSLHNQTGLPTLSRQITTSTAAVAALH